MMNYKPYLYSKGTNSEADKDFSAAPVFSKVRPGSTQLFWKSGLRWYSIAYGDLQRIYRRVEPVYGKLCCGGRSYLIQWLVLVLRDGSELVIHIGDDVQKQAEDLLGHLESAQPQLQYGKV